MTRKGAGKGLRIAAILALAMGVAGCSDPALPMLTQVDDFSLVRENGEAYGLEQLRGHVWIANFIFTTCPSVCPMLTSQMGNVERHTRDVDVRFVSFSVDPAVDTPEVLSRYAGLHDANLSRWAFLTGEVAAVRQVIEERLRMRMGERDESSGDIPHGTHFVLVDPTGRIRGFYRTEGPDLERLERDIRRLADES